MRELNRLLPEGLAEGRICDLQLAELFARLFTGIARQSPQSIRRANPWIGAVTGDVRVDLWRSWAKVQTLLAAGQFPAAVSQIGASFDSYPDAATPALAQLERIVQRTSCVINNAQAPAAALDHIKLCRQRLFETIH